MNSLGMGEGYLMDILGMGKSDTGWRVLECWRGTLHVESRDGGRTLQRESWDVGRDTG